MCCGSFLLVMFHACLWFTVLSVHCSTLVTCLERADLLALLCAVFSCISVTFPHVSWSLTEIRVSLVHLNMFKPSRNWFTDHSKRCFFCVDPLYVILFLYIVILSCLFYAALRSTAGKWLTSSLFRVWCFLVFLSLINMVSWVRCGTWIHQFLILPTF